MPRAIGLVLLALVLSTPGASLSQPATVYRIGFLRSETRDLLFDAFRQGLHELGYVEALGLTIPPVVLVRTEKVIR